MSPARVVVAPGKLVIAGEYAVLDGAPAWVAAVDRGVRCEVFTAEGVEIVTPGDARFVRAALHDAPAARYQFSDSNPVTGLSAKPGFGGSAAATVAATVAAGRPAAWAYDVHRRVQGGGSGIDVYASLNGGLRRFVAGSDPFPAVDPPPLAAVWSGQPALTGPRVALYQAWAGRERFVAESAALAEAFLGNPVRVLRENYALLRWMARGAGLAYDLPAFGEIDRLAAQFGGAAKPSGAGGGDVAVALFPDAAARDAFTRACPAAIPVAVAAGASSA